MIHEDEIARRVDARRALYTAIGDEVVSDDSYVERALERILGGTDERTVLVDLVRTLSIQKVALERVAAPWRRPQGPIPPYREAKPS